MLNESDAGTDKPEDVSPIGPGTDWARARYYQCMHARAVQREQHWKQRALGGEQIIKQLNKLIEVVKVVDLNEGSHLERELMLVKVRALGEAREELKRLSDIFRGRIIDVADNTYTIELTGNGAKLDAFLQALDASLILETVRTGACGIGRGERILKV